jgi:flavin-dependent dehydrogenase
LNKGAIWTYWKGAYRDSGKDEGATMVLQTADRNGWFWYIPQHDDIVSVGVVAPFDYLFKNGDASKSVGDDAIASKAGSYEATYQDEVERCAAVKARIGSATRATGYFATKDYSYRATRVAGDGWVMIGDAWGFLDPLYSSGVLLALRSGEMAADAIVGGLAAGDTSTARLGAWGPLFNQGVDRMRRLVCEYYDGFSFGQFVRSFPHLRNTVTDLLIGDLFTDRVDEVWQPMESLYPPQKRAIPAWNAGAPQDQAPEKANLLVLPAGVKP